MRLRLVAALLCFWGLVLPNSTRAQDPAAAPAETIQPGRVKLAGNLTAAKLVHLVRPVYPPLARQTRISGTVCMHAIVAKDGHIQSLDVISGHPLLQQAALEAVRQWRYEPTLLNDEAVEVDTTIDVLFSMEDHSAPPPLGIDPQLRSDILLMFKVIHFKQSAMAGGRRAFESMRPMLLASLPNTINREKITDAYIEKLLATLQSDGYLERVVGVYARYFSDSDIQQLIQFYQTPAGQHFFAVMPQLSADLNQVGQSLAMENLGIIFKQLCREFPELEEDPRFCKKPDLQRNSELLVPRATKAVGL